MQGRNEATVMWPIAWATAVSLLLAITGVAKAVPPPPRDWDLAIDLYGWIAASDLELRGTAFGGEFANHYDKGLGSAFEDLDGGGGGDIMFRWKRLVAMFDGAWVQSDENSDGWFTNTIVDGKIGVRILDLNPPRSSVPSPDDGHHFTLDLLGGARYRNAETNVDINLNGFGPQRFHDDRDWVDPVVGLGMSVGLLPNLTFSTVADIGGFDVGNSSHLTWSVNPRITYKAWGHLNLFLGWKYLQENHDHHIDIMLNGPQAGIGYSF